MRGFHPPQKAPRRAGFANGGPVRGPGTGTSDEVPDRVPEGTYIMPADSTQAIGEGNLAAMGARGFRPGGAKKVPVNLSNGEFKLPAEQVHAVGVQALEQIKNATHTPVRRARGFKPEMFFADGGLVEEEKPGGAFGGSGQLAKTPDGIGQPPGRPPEPTPAAPPAAPPTTPPAAQQPSAAGQPPAGYNPPAAPAARPSSFGDAAAATRDSSVSQIPTGGYPKAPAADGSQNSWANTDVGRNVTNLANALPGAAGNLLGGVARTGGAISGAINSGSQVARGLATGAALGAAAAPTPASAEPTPAARQPLPAGITPSTAGAGRGLINPPMADPSTPMPPAAPAAAPSQELMPGVYRHGKGQYSDSAAGMGLRPDFTGQPSAQNMAAADALAGRQEQAALSGMGARGFRPGFSGVIGQQGGNGNMWSRTTEQQRRDAEVQASSIHRPTAARGFNALKALDAESLEGVRGANALAQEALRGQSGLAQEGLRQDGYLQREGMQQAGANQRAASRDAIDQQRYGVEAQAKGFDIRAAQRAEKLHEKYEAAKTPEEKSAIAQQIRDLSGKATNPKDDLLVVGGGQEWDSTANVMRNVPQRVFDARTRQYVDGQGAQAPAGPAQPTSKAEYDALPKGAQYIKNGKTYTKG